MEKKPRRVTLYPQDLHSFCATKRACYKLYNDIRQEFNLAKYKRITIFHLRDYFKLSIEDVCLAVFGY